MSRHGKYPAELRKRAVWMVLEHQHEHGSQRETICSVAEMLGPTRGAVGKWVRRSSLDSRADRDLGPCPVSAE